MKPGMLGLTRCPRCGSVGDFAIQRSKEEGREIWEGDVVCGGCSSLYAISAGVLNLLTTPSTVVFDERASYRTSRDEVFTRIRSLSTDEQEAELLRIAMMEHTGEEFRLTSTLNLEQALELVDPKDGQWFLELGAGSGWLTVPWARAGLNCIATDITTDLKLELSPLVMRREDVYFDRALADMTRLPFGDERLDLVFVSASLHHAESLAGSLREAARVLRPGGTLVAINEPMHGLIRRSGKRFVDQAALENPGIHERSFNYFQWRAALRKASLQPRFSFPAYYQAILEGHVATAAASGPFARAARHIWRLPLRSVAMSTPILSLIQILIGINVCVLAKKIDTTSEAGSL